MQRTTSSTGMGAYSCTHWPLARPSIPPSRLHGFDLHDARHGLQGAGDLGGALEAAGELAFDLAAVAEHQDQVDLSRAAVAASTVPGPRAVSVARPVVLRG